VVAGVVGTVLIAIVTLFNLDQVTSRALAHDAFQLAAASSFLAGCIFRLTRFDRTGERHTLLTAVAFGVLAVLATPVGNLASEVVSGRLETPTGLAVHGLGTVTCLLLLRPSVMTRGVSAGRTTSRRFGLAAAVVLGLGLVAVLVSMGLTELLEDHASAQIGDVPFSHVLFEVSLTEGWLTLGLLAARGDAQRPWAQRLGPLLVSLGVVELLRSLGDLRFGWWGLAAGALLASAAMMAAHMAFLDMVGAGGFTVAPTASRRELSLPAVVEDVRPLDVADAVAAVVQRFRNEGLDIRLRRAGAGEACGRATDLTVAVEALLDNAARYATGSPVDVHVVAISDRVEVSVIDHGPGLSALAAETALAGAAFGGGGGLSLARELMRRSDGDLLLRNRIGGATFVLTLPTSDPDREVSDVEVTVRPRIERRVRARV
jgi:hypothetical protein